MWLFLLIGGVSRRVAILGELEHFKHLAEIANDADTYEQAELFLKVLNSAQQRRTILHLQTANKVRDCRNARQTF